MEYLSDGIRVLAMDVATMKLARNEDLCNHSDKRRKVRAETYY